jgi:hypothetical protein
MVNIQQFCRLLIANNQFLILKVTNLYIRLIIQVQFLRFEKINLK